MGRWWWGADLPRGDHPPGTVFVHISRCAIAIYYRSPIRSGDEGDYLETTFTGTGGTHAFTSVPEATYFVEVVDVLQDAVLNPVRKTVTVSLTNPDATATFDGSFTTN